MNAEVSSDDAPETPPACYEEAIEITTLALLTGAANEVDTYSFVQYAFTQETMGKSNETFVNTITYQTFFYSSEQSRLIHKLLNEEKAKTCKAM